MRGRFVIMGVSGCGKSSVGTAVAQRTGLHFVDGDDLHRAANIAKMSQGIALQDEDRLPWLIDISKALAARDGQIIGCSALKRSYRDLIRDRTGNQVTFLHLHAPKDVLIARVTARQGHFMPTDLLESQFADLEPLGAGEIGHVIDIDAPFDVVVANAVAQVVAAG